MSAESQGQLVVERFRRASRNAHCKYLLRLAPVNRKGGLKVQRLIAATSDSFRAELLGLV
jgi:hypothetical protein